MTGPFIEPPCLEKSRRAFFATKTVGLRHRELDLAARPYGNMNIIRRTADTTMIVCTLTDFFSMLMKCPPAGRRRADGRVRW